MRRGEPFAWGLAATVTLHASAAVAIVLGHRIAAPPPAAPEVMVARLVRLGKPRPPDLLPRKPTAPPPAPTPVPAVDPAPKPETKPALATKPDPSVKPADLRTAMARARALARSAEEIEEPEGRPEGVAEGTSDRASEGDPYATEVWRRIKEGWRVPEMVSDRDLRRLRAVVFLRLSANGQIVEHRIVEPSGNRFFDASALEAIVTVQRLPPPPRAFLVNGINLEFVP